MPRRFLALCLLAGGLNAAELAQTPPMGWNSWNKFHREVSDKLIREIADAMVSSGMRDAGYVYVNIDDTWEAKRDAQGNIQPNEKFPDMKALAGYVHSKGLKLGIYSSPGPLTCAKYEGSYQHEEQDARQYAAWGIDYLKYDWCSARTVYKPEQMKEVYKKMGDALAHSGRPIVFSLCQYGLQNVWEWGPSVGGNLWRTTGDIHDTWESMSRIGFDKQVNLASYAGPGHWNDPDMLEIGNGGMNTDEYKTHISLWCLLAAPLLAGNDIRSMSPEIHDILTNKDVIAIDQDKLGTQASRIWKEGGIEMWAKPLSGGEIAVGLFNRRETSTLLSASWAELHLKGGRHEVWNLWSHSSPEKVRDQFSVQVPAHGVVLIRVK